jgi:uncharacterized membrane protein YvbJ
MANFCEKCGSAITEPAKFCVSCGALVGASSETPSAVTGSSQTTSPPRRRAQSRRPGTGWSSPGLHSSSFLESWEVVSMSAGA